MFIRTKNNGYHTYLQIVESERVGNNIIQHTHCNLGRLDKLQESGKLDGLLRSGLRFSKKLLVLDAHEKGECTRTNTIKVGPPLLIEKVWQKLGIKKTIERIASKRRFEFPVERAIFLTVLHRLFVSGSDRAAEKWAVDYKIEGVGGLSLHHLYRTMGWLGYPLPSKEQAWATPFTPRCTKDVIEEELFYIRRDLFSDMDLVFFDTTSIYFEGDGNGELRRYGKSKDHRPDLKQIVVGIVLDNEGNPICSEIIPGNTTDIMTLIPVVKRLEKRFSINSVCIVADRGMISKKTMNSIERLNWRYILGVRMRKVKEVKHDVLMRGGRYREIYSERKRSKDPWPLKVKEVKVNDTRYIVCHNEEQAEKDRYTREAIVDSLSEKLKQGDKALVGNKGYRKYLKTPKDGFAVDERKVKEDERYDGKWVLTTNTDLSSEETALKYKQLWMVEDIFRTMKSIIDTRPIYHKCDETIRGHVFCSFLAIMCRKYIQDRIFEKGWEVEWADLIRDVNKVEEIEVEHNNKQFVIRTETSGNAGKAFQAVKVGLPPVIREEKIRGTTLF